MIIKSKKDALKLLDTINAPEHLKAHVQLVGEAGDMLLKALTQLEISINSTFVKIGIVIHDIGKTLHSNEMTGPGSEHEPAGERMLLELGIDPEIARVCLSHARWSTMRCSLEELIIALADKLWKGKRVEKLEMLVIDKIADAMHKDRWDVFSILDAAFEEIAVGGDHRLQRSVNYE